MSARDSLTPSETATVWRQLFRARLREFIQFDSPIAGVLSASLALVLAMAHAVIGRNRRALELLSAAHRATRFRPVRAGVERILRRPPALGTVIARQVNKSYDSYLQSVASDDAHRRPENLIGSRLMVVKS